VRVSVHPTLAAIVRRDLDDSAKNLGSDVSADCAMIIYPFVRQLHITAFSLRAVAWDWIEYWCGERTRSPSYLHSKFIATVHAKAPGLGENAGVKFGWGNMLVNMLDAACFRCHGPGKYPCMGEHCIARYCSRACQKAHWSKHKSECNMAPPPGSWTRVNAAGFVNWLGGDDKGDDFVRAVLRRVPPSDALKIGVKVV
jgi:hypothetical protein